MRSNCLRQKVRSAEERAHQWARLVVIYGPQWHRTGRRRASGPARALGTSSAGLAGRFTRHRINRAASAPACARLARPPYVCALTIGCQKCPLNRNFLNPSPFGCGRVLFALRTCISSQQLASVKSADWARNLFARRRSVGKSWPRWAQSKTSALGRPLVLVTRVCFGATGNGGAEKATNWLH